MNRRDIPNMKNRTNTPGALASKSRLALKTLARKFRVALLFAAAMPLCSLAQSPPTTGLQLWLKADAGVTTNSSGLVTTWADQSGLGNDAIQTNAAVAPSLVMNSLNGKPTLRFPGDVTRYMDVADSASMAAIGDNVTMFVVMSFDDFDGHRVGVTKAKNNLAAPIDWYAPAGNGRAQAWVGDGAHFDGWLADSRPRPGVVTVHTTSWANGRLDQYLNQFFSGSGEYAGRFVPADPDPGNIPMRIGTRADLATQLKGNLAEILVYNPGLSDADRTSVVNYLKTKWNLDFLQAPTVTITTPANALTVAAGATVPVRVSASDPNTGGSLSSVKLYNNGVQVASWTQTPYNVDLSMPNPGTAVLTVEGIDNYGARATATATVTVTGTAPAKPSGGLSVWLRADVGVNVAGDGTVSSWADQSGSANDAAQADPSLAPERKTGVVNGLPAVYFGPNKPYLEIPDYGTAFTTTGFTFLVQARFENFGNYRALVAKTTGGTASPVDWYYNYPSGTGLGAWASANVGGTGVGATMRAIEGQFATYGLTFNGTNLSHYIGLVNDGTGVIGGTPSSDGSPMLIGRRGDGVTQMLGDIAEILMYDHALSASDQRDAVGYLSSKYGLAQALVSNPPLTLSITTPTNGATATVNSAVMVTINAASTVGSIASVKVMANGKQLATLTVGPYQVPLQFLSVGQVTLTAVAVDNGGVQSTSAPVVVTVTGPAVTTPPTSGLGFWLSADSVNVSGDAVMSWNDKSGNGNNANLGRGNPTLAANSINGKPAVHFYPQDYFEITYAPTLAFAGDVSTYAVVRFDNFAKYPTLWTQTMPNSVGAPIDYYIPGDGYPIVMQGDGASQTDAHANQPVAAGQYMVLGWEIAQKTATHYIDGIAVGGRKITSATADKGNNVIIGSRGDYYTELRGDMAEVLAFSRALTPTEHAQVLAYLGSKYNLAMVSVATIQPTVAITSPANGSTVAVSTPFTVTASVTGTTIQIGQIDFLVNGVTVGSVSSAPYSLTLQALSPGPISITAQATDVFGNKGVSAPVALTATGQGPTSPAATGLVLWLTADKGVSTNSDGTVAEWVDQSGLGNNALPPDSTVAPTLVTDSVTGKPALAFNGYSSYLSVTSSPSLFGLGSLSTFAAVNMADVDTTHTIWSKTTDGKATPAIYFVNQGGAFYFSRPSSTEGSLDRLSPGVPAAAGATIGSALMSFYLNGQPSGTRAFGSGADDAGNPLVIGALDNLTSMFTGNMSSLLIYNKVLEGSDLQLANAYIAAKSGVAMVAVTQPLNVSLAITRLSGSTVQISWPTSTSGWILQSVASLGGTNWTPVVTNPPNNTVVVGATNVTRYFRLQSQ